MLFRYGLIGAGNMGEPVLRGTIEHAGAEKVAVCEISAAKRKELETKYGVTTFEDAKSLAENSAAIILCVKPQVLPAVLDQIAPAVTEGQQIISIVAGVSCEMIKSRLLGKPHVVRVMPNMPAMVGAGMSSISFDESLTPDSAEVKDTEDIFIKIGETIVIPEKLMDAVTCAAGSSPAYVFMFIEALADSAVKYGIPRPQAYKLVAQTVMGSAKLMLQMGEHPASLKDKVCSPGGTTIAGVEALENAGFRGAIMQATDACYERSVSLGKKQ